MRLRPAIHPLWFLAVLASLPPAPVAFAAPVAIVDPPATATSALTEAAAGACTLVNGPLSSISTGFPGPDYLTAIAVAINPSGCSACPSPQLLNLNLVSFRLRWLGACSATAEVSIIGATGAPGCLAPDPSQVLCPPVSHTISSPGPGGVVHTLPIPSGCCISGPAFVRVRFIGLDQCLASGAAAFVTSTTLPCSSCQTWWSWALASPALSDQCLVAGDLNSQTWMSVDADCCAPTGAPPRSWGGVKTLYR